MGGNEGSVVSADKCRAGFSIIYATHYSLQQRLCGQKWCRHRLPSQLSVSGARCWLGTHQFRSCSCFPRVAAFPQPTTGPRQTSALCGVVGLYEVPSLVRGRRADILGVELRENVCQSANLCCQGVQSTATRRVVRCMAIYLT